MSKKLGKTIELGLWVTPKQPSMVSTFCVEQASPLFFPIPGKLKGYNSLAADGEAHFAFTLGDSSSEMEDPLCITVQLALKSDDLITGRH